MASHPSSATTRSSTSYSDQAAPRSLHASSSIWRTSAAARTTSPSSSQASEETSTSPFATRASPTPSRSSRPSRSPSLQRRNEERERFTSAHAGALRGWRDRREVVLLYARGEVEEHEFEDTLLRG